ncbi:MAG: glycosyltransferase family 2 protein [Verrucomicrobiales bacterium]|nr:glycosyltransferase family 2 protein [Verrucomicrobiales bacterium]
MKTSSDSTVAVVIPAFGRPRRLRQAVESVLNQEETDFQLVVVDDASPLDFGLSDVREFVERAGHRWIVHSENRGPAASRNTGAAATSAEWIAFLDSDDTWEPRKLAAQLEWHREHPDFQISQCEEGWIRKGKPADKPTHLQQPDSGRIFSESTRRCCISPSAVLMSRDLWNEAGGFDEWFRVCEDYELWLRITARHPVGFVPGKWVTKFGGASDQLTASVPHGIDRWRIAALLKFLETGNPDGAQFDATISALLEKAAIIGKKGFPEPTGSVH